MFFAVGLNAMEAPDIAAEKSFDPLKVEGKYMQVSCLAIIFITICLSWPDTHMKKKNYSKTHAGCFFD